MGWKSTIDITRTEAIKAIREDLNLEEMDNRQLVDLLESMGFGDDLDKKWFGYNFNVINE